VSARNCRCAIEVVNTGSREDRPSPAGISAGAVQDGRRYVGERTDRVAVADEPLSAIAEHGRGLKIIDAVVDNLQLTGDERRGTTLHFEKTLEWVPGAPGRHLFNADAGRLG
jgi:hypothetical protein